MLKTANKFFEYNFVCNKFATHFEQMRFFDYIPLISYSYLLNSSFLENMPANFDPSVFSSYDNLRNFFISSDAPERVALRNSLLISKAIIPLNPNLNGIWQVGQLATADFRYLTAIILKVIARIFSLVDAKGIAKQIKISSQYIMGGFAIYSDSPTHVFFLQKTQNHPNDRALVSLAPPIHVSQITDPRVRSRLFLNRSENRESIHLIREEMGVCLGAVYWFLYLYFKTKQQFSDPRKHMIALGKEFSKGGGAEAVLLQNLRIRNGDLLNMRIGVQDELRQNRRVVPLCAYFFEAWENDIDQIVEEISYLPPGAYHVRVPFHALAYIKIDDRLSFLIDPNHGVLEINGEDVAGTLHHELQRTAREILQDVERRNPSLYETFRNQPVLSVSRLIYFLPVQG